MNVSQSRSNHCASFLFKGRGWGCTALGGRSHYVSALGWHMFLVLCLLASYVFISCCCECCRCRYSDIALTFYCWWQYCFQHCHTVSFIYFFSVDTITDEILHEHVPWQPLESYWISRLKVKVTWVFVPFCLHDTHGQYLAFSEGFTCWPAIT